VRWVLRPAESLLAVSLMLSGCAANPLNPNPPATFRDAATAQSEVKRLERAWLNAYERHDGAAMQNIVADEFVITFPDGKSLTKAAVLAQLSQPQRPGSQSPRFFTEGVVANVFAAAVILRGTLVTESGSGPTLRRRLNSYTDTYIRRGGKWQVVASHLSQAPN